MAVTLREVAERAGVSRSAVSRTFTEGAPVSPQMRARVEKAATELGYAPNALASSLTTGRTRLVGLIVNNFRNPLILEVFDLFTSGLQDRGLRPLMVNLGPGAAPLDPVRLLRQYAVDGVIVASSTLPPSLAATFRQAGIAAVHAFGRPSPRPPVHVAGIDNVACGRMAAGALLARGHARVGFLGGPATATSTEDRMAGFLTALGGHPGVIASTSHASDYTFDAGRAEMQRLLAAGQPAEAYFCADDMLATGALSAIREAGLRVPEDIGLIGLNDMEMARWPDIGLTTIRQPVDRIIAAAIDLVSATIANPALPPEIRLFPCRIVERRTLRPAA
jgi:DNA-binding LacI/PurR family transcriptional regulator